jgi:hypothetical protein
VQPYGGQRPGKPFGFHILYNEERGQEASRYMKKTALLVSAIVLFASLSAYSQAQSTDNPDMFVKTVPVVKVYTHALGYKVLFVKSNLEMGGREVRPYLYLRAQQPVVVLLGGA